MNRKTQEHPVPPTSPCPACTASQWSYSETINRFFAIPPQYAIFLCRNCHLGFRPNMPPYPEPAEKERIEARYQLCSGEYTAGTHTVNPRMQRRLQRLARIIPSHLPRRLLDIGAGTGSFLHEAEKYGFDVLGTELEPAYASKTVLNIDITDPNTDLAELGKFSVIHLNHVLEHVHDPVKLLSIIPNLMHAGAILCVEVPNEIFSLAARIKRILAIPAHSSTAWFGHRFFFSKKAFREIFQRHTSLRPVHLSTPYIAEELDLLHQTIDRIQSTLGIGAVLEGYWQKT